MKNPLLEEHRFPPFERIEAEHVVPAIKSLIENNRQGLERLLEQLQSEGRQPSWDSLVVPLEEADDKLSNAWSPVSHMNAVVNSGDLREAYNQCIVALTEYGTELGQHPGLYRAYRQLAESSDYRQLSVAQRKSIDNALRDFRLAGVALEEDKK